MKGIRRKDLKPCPFCGGTNLKVWDNCVCCMDWPCGGNIDFGHFIGYDKKSSKECQDAVSKAWNTRVKEVIP